MRLAGTKNADNFYSEKDEWKLWGDNIKVTLR
jgi:hypothetical protein